MKKLLLFGCLAFGFAATSQTTIFTDDFESGGANWTLNSGGFGDNDWIINNSFIGGFFPSTPTQPGAITNSPQSQYLHIYNNSLACSGLGDCQAVFLASAGGDKTAEMVNNVVTTGMTNVTFDFYYLCAGQPGTTYGAVDYSLDNGSTWINAATNYAGQPNWTPASLTDPAWDNQAQLKFRFHWIEGPTGSDPAFAVDQVEISATSGGASNTITTTDDVSPGSWCQGTDQLLTVNYTSTGTWNAGNVFSIQLSDAAGSFASPTVIGSVASISNSGVVTGTVAGATAAGAGYRVRIVGSDPATTGSDNVSDLVINALPTVTMTPFSQVCVNDPAFTLTGGSPSGGDYTGAGITANSFDPSSAGVGSHIITYTYTDGNSCSNTAQESLVVDPCASNTLTTTDDVSPATWCEGSDELLTVNYTSSGTWNAGNVFSIQMSDAAGSFASPTVIGSVASTSANGAVTGTVPGATPAGTGYRVRIVGSDPATTGSDNVSDLVINPLPSVTMTAFSQVCVYDAFFTLTGGAPAGGDYTGPGITANVFDPSVAGNGTHTITYTYSDGTCSNFATETITVDACASINEETLSFGIYPNPTEEMFTIDTELNVDAVELLDLEGRIVKTFLPQTNYNVAGVPTGVYLVRMISADKTSVQRIMIK